MRKYIMLMMLLLVCMISMTADAYVRPYAQTTTNQIWWMARKWNKERIEWIDHTGRTNLTIRVINGPDNVIGSNGHGIMITVAPDLSVVSYSLGYANFREGWSISRVAPGTYDFQNGKWYGDMTDEEKTAMWVAYTNKVLSAQAADKAEREAPAKFDVSRSVEEYETYLLGGRAFEDLTPDEQFDLRAELAVYREEWTRVNDPENYRPNLLPKFNNNMTEQQKIHSRRGRWFR